MVQKRLTKKELTALKTYPKTLEELLHAVDKELDYKDVLSEEGVSDADWGEEEDYKLEELTPQEQIEDMFSSFEQEGECDEYNDEGPFDECDEDGLIISAPRRGRRKLPSKPLILISREDFAKKCMTKLATSLLGKLAKDKEVVERIKDIINSTSQTKTIKLARLKGNE